MFRSNATWPGPDADSLQNDIMQGRPPSGAPFESDLPTASACRSPPCARREDPSEKADPVQARAARRGFINTLAGDAAQSVHETTNWLVSLGCRPGRYVKPGAALAGWRSNRPAHAGPEDWTGSARHCWKATIARSRRGFARWRWPSTRCRGGGNAVMRFVMVIANQALIPGQHDLRYRERDTVVAPSAPHLRWARHRGGGGGVRGVDQAAVYDRAAGAAAHSANIAPVQSRSEGPRVVENSFSDFQSASSICPSEACRIAVVSRL